MELTKADGTTQTFSNVERGKSDTLTMSEWGFTTAGGTIDPMAAYVYQDPPTAFGAGTFFVSGSSGGPFNLTWKPSTLPVLRMKDGKQITPGYGDEYTVEYAHAKNTFTLSDDGTGILSALGLDLKDEAHYTAAEDAEMILNGEKVTRSSNKISPESLFMFWIFADYANYALALDNFALVTHLLYRRTNFHSSLLKIYSTFRLHQV